MAKVTLIRQLRTWWQLRTGRAETPLDGEAPTFLVSLVFHVALLLLLYLIPVAAHSGAAALLITSAPVRQESKALELPQEFFFSALPTEDVGANSLHGLEAAISQAPVVSDVSAVPTPSDLAETPVNSVQIDDTIQQATGLNYNVTLPVRGSAGHGTTGASGAIDRLTHEILLSLEQRKTLVVWLFDQSYSMSAQRREVKDRLDRVYRELGLIEAAANPAFKKHDDKPLLTSIGCFGQKVSLLTKTPTDDLSEIQAAVEGIEVDESGMELVFTAVYQAANQYKQYRHPSPTTKEPDRNVMIVVFTDEAGEDQHGLDQTVQLCRKLAMPVYVVGVPAPFGQQETLVKWVHPDTKYDQTPQWAVVNQGPETLLPERIRLDFDGSHEARDPIDSGFGPYALTRLCYETGGIFFTVHPNRTVNRAVGRREVDVFSAHLQHFFDPEVMRKYRPDYVSAAEYERRVKQNRARQSLVEAARLAAIAPMEGPEYRFVKQSDAALAGRLSEAQKKAAILEPRIEQLYQLLAQGEAQRAKETNLRWQAGYDLAMGRVLAVKVRTEAYNAMLAQAKSGLEFKNPQNNTWVIAPANTLSVGSQYEKLAEKAKTYLERVVKEHPDTPWALIASRELKAPLGWQWREEFTDLTPPRPPMLAGNNNPRPPVNDTQRSLPRPPPKAPLLKL
jgi:hypothetical protein